MTNRFVDIRQARVSLEVQEGQTILDAALAAGIPYPTAAVPAAAARASHV